jgi:hypothetical protein
MNRWVGFFACVLLGLGMLVCGLLVPAHLRAVDVIVLQNAGRNTETLTDRGMKLVREEKLGAAQLVSLAARRDNLAGLEKLEAAITKLESEHPDWKVWGCSDRRLEQIIGSSEPPSGSQADVAPGASDGAKPASGETETTASRAGVVPFTDFIVHEEHREKALTFLDHSWKPGVQAVMACRTLTNTAIFAPSESASGQAFDAALAISGLLLEEDRLTASLRDKLSALAVDARQGRDSQPFEQALLDLLSLGQRLNWGQLAALVGRVDDAGTLRLLANLAREDDTHLPVLFSATELSGKPAAVTAYLAEFNRTGHADLGTSLRFGTGGVDELLRRNQQVLYSSTAERAGRLSPLAGFSGFATDYSLRSPEFALALKWLLYLAGGYLLAAAVHLARPAASALEEPLKVRGFHVAREILFALGFLLVVLLLSEPFLAQESQKAEFPFRLRLPTVGRLVPVGTVNAHQPIMSLNPKSLLTLVLFFIIQALLYVACLVKLAEIRRQRVPSRVKLKLLENEDHLFDAGLYVGFAGTIISLILVSLNVIQPSLMAAYSSTSFGIVFVSIFKIFHLRGVRRGLLLDAEAAAYPEPMPKAAAPALAVQP